MVTLRVFHLIKMLILGTEGPALEERWGPNPKGCVVVAGGGFETLQGVLRHYRSGVSSLTEPVRRPLMGGPQCHLSILRNVPCRYFCNFHVAFKIAQYHLSNLRNSVLVIFLPVLIGFMLILTNGHVALSNLRVTGPCQASLPTFRTFLT